MPVPVVVPSHNIDVKDAAVQSERLDADEETQSSLHVSSRGEDMSFLFYIFTDIY